jgi:ribosomal protein S12 methylthiotransferase
VIRSTFIVGFPGETEAEFQELLDWLKVAQLDRVGCFEYSPVEGATANELADPVPDEVKADRLARFMKAQAKISKARLKKRVGKLLDIMVDGTDEDGVLVGRSYGEAPEIDGKVYLSCEIPLKPGQIVKARVLESNEHDLHAEVIED